MNIKFFDGGGSFVPPYVVYQPSGVPSVPEMSGLLSTPDKSTNKEHNEMMKSLLGILKDVKALPGDSERSAAVLANLLERITGAATEQDITGLGFNTAMIASDYLKAINLIKNMEFNKTEYDDAKKTAVLNGGIHEAAIDSYGRVIVMTEDGFDWKTPELIAKNRDKYLVVTNADLLKYRAYGYGGLAFNNEVLSVVSNSMGMLKITEHISDIIKHLGTYRNSNEQYLRALAGDLIKGLEDFAKAKKEGKYDATIEDLYKVKILSEDQYESAKMALGYIYTSLPATAKSLLKLKTKNGTDTEAYQVLLTLVYSTINPTSEFEIDMKSNALTLSDKTDTDSDEQKFDFVTSVQAGRGARTDLFKIDSGKVSMQVLGDVYESVLSKEGNDLKDMSISEVLSKSGLKSIINGSIGIYFGNQKLTDDDVDNIVFEGNGMIRANLPIDSNGAPNFNLLNLYEEAMKEYHLSLKAGLKVTLQSILAKDKYKDLRNLFNLDGTPNKEKFGPFIVMNGVTTDKLISLDDKSIINNRIKDFITINKYNTKVIETIKRSLAIGTGKNIQYPDIDERDWEVIFPWNSHDEIYRGAIYIPINMNPNAAAMGDNQNLKTKTNSSNEEAYLRSLISPSAI